MNTNPGKSRVVVTGANGFIGRALCDALREQNFAVRPAVRTPSNASSEVVVGTIGRDTQWEAALSDVDVVIHLAARVHLLNDKARDPLAEFREVNVEGTKKLAYQAVQMGVKRLIFVSSIKVNGDNTRPGEKFSESSIPHPDSPYGISKWEAEQALNALQGKIQIVIVRPPLVYGANAPGNMSRLLRLVDRGFPLPFAATTNRRSLIGVDNLVDFLIRCVDSPAASNQTFLVSDGDDVSTAQLVRLLSDALNRPACLFPLPEMPIRLVARLVGKLERFDQLWGSLAVDSRKACERLGWIPPFSVQEEIHKMVQAYLKTAQR